MKPAVITDSPDEIRSILEHLLQLNVEGITIRRLSQTSEISEHRLQRILDDNTGIFYGRVFKGHRFYYLRHSRFLKTAYFIIKHAHVSAMDFGWSDEQVRVMCVTANPKYTSRSIFSVATDASLSQQRTAEIIDGFVSEGLLMRNNNMVAFGYMGFPVWAAIVIGRFFV